ncbi:hypothetical protein F383_20287 [Gossypium arboreum]|uniref:Uncharacterized protein n=1 Tax=Gossypium arboreum TaxID=29729 RepID=A0A0B0NPF5_GOSAR|nr:hypothetical protein F383_20287 [Gossypium arboreum]
MGAFLLGQLIDKLGH